MANALDFLSMEAKAPTCAGPHTIHDPSTGEKFDVWLRPLTAPEWDVVSDKSAQVYLEFSGMPERGIEPTREPLMVPGYDRSVPVSLTLIQNALMIEMMQDGVEVPPANRLDFMRCVACSVKRPVLWRLLVAHATSLRLPKATGPEPDGTGTI
jgi:hypothetical protein